MKQFRKSKIQKGSVKDDAAFCIFTVKKDFYYNGDFYDELE